MSSIPIPSIRKGIRGWAGVKTKPILEQMPYDDKNANRTLNRPMAPKNG